MDSPRMALADYLSRANDAAVAQDMKPIPAVVGRYRQFQRGMGPPLTSDEANELYNHWAEQARGQAAVRRAQIGHPMDTLGAMLQSIYGAR